MEKNPAEQTVSMLRSQRHSMMNHLQVILGWLQLGRPERARQYLETLASRMAGEGEAIRQAPAATALVMLTLGLEAETHGVQLDWRVCGPVPPASDDELEVLAARVREAFHALAGLPEPEHTIRIDLGQRIDLHTPRPAGER